MIITTFFDVFFNRKIENKTEQKIVLFYPETELIPGKLSVMTQANLYVGVLSLARETRRQAPTTYTFHIPNPESLRLNVSNNPSVQTPRSQLLALKLEVWCTVCAECLPFEAGMSRFDVRGG